MIAATEDPALTARIVSRRALAYGSAADAADDRADFVRAASGLAWIDGALAIVQDDTSFVAIERAGGRLGAIALPAGPGGRRRFEERRGNKGDKLDLECCLALGRHLVAFGSGATRRREVVVEIDVGAHDGAVRVVDAGDLHAAVRAALGTTALNLEGAVAQGERLRLFQRGNDAGHAGADAVIDVDLVGFVAWLAGGATPAVRAVQRFDLGAIGGVRFGFTDACALDASRVLFLAAAEASPNAIDDGIVAGTRVGILDDGGARVTALLDEDGAPAAVKAEGVALVPGRDDRLWVVLDPDDVDRAAELCEVALAGPWR
jgi:hypothetical protein